MEDLMRRLERERRTEAEPEPDEAEAGDWHPLD
jgi:hypothetical protein